RGRRDAPECPRRSARRICRSYRSQRTRCWSAHPSAAPAQPCPASTAGVRSAARGLDSPCLMLACAPSGRKQTMPDARVTNTITGRDAFLRVLSDEGVVKMFGNPGTTELPIMHALSSAPEMGYVLGLQEAVVIAMADGYARASGKLVSCNVHVAPGLGNAIGSIYTSLVSGTPMIVTAGQQEQGHGLTEPLLYAPLVPIATPVVKWATEVNRIEDLPRILRRAAKVATTAPTGPVFVSLPGDILNNEAPIDLGTPT